ncbi:hypothetical protein MMC11_002700 [Xylographa trunciseda]|nr:hypothetical protein [Xylographa trunciseda]
MELVPTLHQSVIQERYSGFTPARRRAQPLPVQSPAVATTAPWTTTRCNRLLRPLSSRVALLRKHRELQIQRLCEAEAAIQSERKKSLSKPENEMRLFPAGFQPPSNTAEDPDWTPQGVPRKKLKRTYSSKSCTFKGRGSETRIEPCAALLPVVSRIQVPAMGLHITKGFEPWSLDGSGPEHRVMAKECLKKEDGESGTHATCVFERKSSSVQSFSRDSFRRLAKSVSPSEWMLQDGLYTGLEALLKATKRGTPPRIEGARSLFSVCLRNIPLYIAVEQHWADQDDEDSNIDVALNTYVDLEAFSSAENGGWKPLREVARAHGVTIIGDGIRDGSVGPAIARGLIILCLQVSACDEAEFLVNCLLSRLGPIAKPSTPSDSLFVPHTSIALQTLRDFSNQSGRRRVLFSQLNCLLSEKIIPVEWISSQDMVSCWNQVVVSITQQDSYANEAVALLRTAVALSFNSGNDPKAYHVQETGSRSRIIPTGSKIRAQNVSRRSKSDRSLAEDKHLDRGYHQADQLSAALTNTISNLLTVLLSITLVSSERQCADISFAHGLTQDVLLALALKSYDCETAICDIQACSDHSRHATRWCLPLLANAILMKSFESKAESRQDWMGQLRLLAKLKSTVGLTDEMASFLCSTAQCSAQAGTKTAFQYMQSMVTWLFDLASSASSDNTAERGLQNLAVKAALEFAEQTNERDHLDWALELEESADLRVTASHVRHGSRLTVHVIDKTAAGFRWEAGICEWVAKTPAPSQRKTIVYAVADEANGPEQEHEHVQGMTVSPLQPNRSSRPCKASIHRRLSAGAGSVPTSRQSHGVRMNDRHCRTGCSDKKKRARRPLQRLRGAAGDTAWDEEASTLSECSGPDGGEGEVDELIALIAHGGVTKGSGRHLLDVTNDARGGLARAAMQPGDGTGARERRSPTLRLKRRRSHQKWEARCSGGQENVSEDELAV